MNEIMDPKLKADLDRQLKEELKSDSDNPVPTTTVFALKQKFGLLAASAVDVANLKGALANDRTNRR